MEKSTRTTRITPLLYLLVNFFSFSLIYTLCIILCLALNFSVFNCLQAGTEETNERVSERQVGYCSLSEVNRIAVYGELRHWNGEAWVTSASSFGVCSWNGFLWHLECAGNAPYSSTDYYHIEGSESGETIEPVQDHDGEYIICGTSGYRIYNFNNTGWQGGLIIDGNGGDDILRGTKNGDILIGGSGNDILEI